MNGLDDFADFCSELVLDNGERMVLHDFQRQMLADYFEGVRETLILVPKKQGKTTLLGALSLYHLLTTADAECVIAAASRDQATILYDAARGFVRRTEALADEVEIKRGYRELRVADGDGRIRVLAADVDTADGVIPTLALVDELHRHKTSGLYGVFRDGLGPREGKLLTISTAGDDEQSPLGRLRTMAHSLPGAKRDGAYRRVRSEGFALHEWALDLDQDRDDLELVKTANPAPWQTIELLRERHDSPSMTPWQWARFACGVWLSGEGAAVSDQEWRAVARPGLQIPEAIEGPVIGIDIGRRVDCTAVVAVRRQSEETITVEPLAIIAPPGDGLSISEEEIWEPIAEAAERWPDATFVADPKLGGDFLTDRIERAFPRATVATFDQVPTALARAAQQFTEILASGKLEHPDDETLNAHVLAAKARPVGEGFRFIKSRKDGRSIDGLIALAMALSTMLAAEQEPKHARAVW